MQAAASPTRQHPFHQFSQFLTDVPRSVPKTFGLTELKKGYFPHKFNIPDHQECVGPVPAIDHYMPEVMSPEGRQKFETCHKEQRDSQVLFDFQKELVAYCESDVHLLKEGCLTFKRLFEAKTRFNLFDHITIASTCNRDLRMNRMIPNSLAGEPVGGFFFFFLFFFFVFFFFFHCFTTFICM